MVDFTKTIVAVLQGGNWASVTSPTQSRNTDCNFCRGAHFIRECKIVDEYILAGKCRRNFEGKVIPSPGAFCPRDIPGTLLQEQIDEWHHRNSNQLVVASLVHTINTNHHCGTHEVWKSYPGLAFYVRYFVPLWLENHILVIHLHDIYCTPAVGKSYFSHPFMWDI